jgi:hypothetical protein
VGHSQAGAWWDDAWLAISDGVNEPAAYVAALLSEANHDLARLIDELDGRLEPGERERLFGQSKLLAALELAITGAEVAGRDTFVAIEVKPRRENRVRWRIRIPMLNRALRRAAELKSAGFSKRRAEAIATSEFRVSRTELKDWEARSADFFGRLVSHSPKT